MTLTQLRGSYMAYLCVNSRQMDMNEGKPGSQALGYCAAPSPAPWECAWTCKHGPGAPCIWPHCVPGSSPWWALRLRSAAGTNLEQCQNISVTTAATILMPKYTHSNPQCTQPSTQWCCSSKTKRKQPLCLLWECGSTLVYSTESLQLSKMGIL